MAEIQPFLTTPRLVLRKLKPEDAADIYALRSHPEVNRYIARQKWTTREDADEFINFIIKVNAQKKWFYWALTLRGKDQPIGTICLWNFSDDRKVADVGYELHPDYQRQGLMQEAFAKILSFGFDDLQLHKMQAFTHFENAASIKLLEKNGFSRTKQQEGDEVVFSLKPTT